MGIHLAFDKERGCLRLTMTKLWQLMQSSETKNLNLEKDLDEILSKIKQMGWNESIRTESFWTQITVMVPDSSHRWRAYCPSQPNGSPGRG